MTYRGYGAYGYRGEVGSGAGVGGGRGGAKSNGGGRVSGMDSQRHATTFRRGGGGFANGGVVKGRGGWGGGKRKVDGHPSEGGQNKRIRYDQHFSLSTDQCVSVEVRPEGGASFNLVDFSVGVSPLMWGGGRKDVFALKTPESVPEFFDRLADVRCTSTFLANQCSSCQLAGSDHDISDKKVYFLGDQFLPWRVGGEGDCVPTIRVENADFQQLKNVLFAQKKSGFEPPQGSVFAVALLCHLARVGNTTFWSHFADFSAWCQRHLGAVCWPFLPAFSESLPEQFRVSTHQFMVEMQGRHNGDFLKKKDARFSLWMPFEKVSKKYNINMVKIVAPNVCMNVEGERVLFCPKNWLAGFWGGFL